MTTYCLHFPIRPEVSDWAFELIETVSCKRGHKSCAGQRCITFFHKEVRVGQLSGRICLKPWNKVIFITESQFNCIWNTFQNS